METADGPYTDRLPPYPAVPSHARLFLALCPLCHAPAALYPARITHITHVLPPIPTAPMSKPHRARKWLRIVVTMAPLTVPCSPCVPIMPCPCPPYPCPSGYAMPPVSSHAPNPHASYPHGLEMGGGIPLLWTPSLCPPMPVGYPQCHAPAPISCLTDIPLPVLPPMPPIPLPLPGNVLDCC